MSIAERGTARGVDLKEPAGSGWMNPDWLRQDKMRAQAGSLADTPAGNWLKPGRIFSQTLELSRWYLGQTPEGPVVFGVVPQDLRSRRSRKVVPLDRVLAFDRAKERGFRRAVEGFYVLGQLSLDQAKAQLGGKNPFEAVDELSDLPKLQSRKPIEKKLPLKTSGSDSVLAAVGTVVAVTAMAESAKRLPKKDEQGRRYRLVRGLYVGSTALTTAGLALSACLPQPAEVVATGMPTGVVNEPGSVEKNDLTLSVVQEALLPWTAVDIGDQQKFRLNGPVIFIGEADEPENLLTVSPAREDGSVETSVQWAVGKAEIKSSRDGSLAVMPMLVEYDKNSGQSHVYGLFLNEAESNQTQLVFTMGVVQEGQFFKTQLRLMVTRDSNGNSLQVIDLDTNQVLDLVDPTGAGQPPTQVPDNVNQLVDGLIGFLTGAKVVLAQEPSPTPPPTATKEPTATPDPNPQVLVESTHPLWAEVEATVNSLVEHEVKGVIVGVEGDLVVVRERETNNIVVYVEGWGDKDELAGRSDKWVVAQAVEGTTQTPFIVDDAWAEIPSSLRLQPQDQSKPKWYVSYSDGSYFFSWRNQAEVFTDPRPGMAEWMLKIAHAGTRLGQKDEVERFIIVAPPDVDTSDAAVDAWISDVLKRMDVSGDQELNEKYIRQSLGLIKTMSPEMKAFILAYSKKIYFDRDSGSRQTSDGLHLNKKYLNYGFGSNTPSYLAATLGHETLHEGQDGAGFFSCRSSWNKEHQTYLLQYDWLEDRGIVDVNYKKWLEEGSYQTCSG